MKTTPIFVLAVVVACLWGCTSTPDGHDTTLKGTADTTRAVQDGTATTAETSAERKASFAQVQVGMKDEKVRALLGGPSKVETINPEVGARVEDWWYGSNQKVRMTGGQVTRICVTWQKSRRPCKRSMKPAPRATMPKRKGCLTSWKQQTKD